MLCSIKSTFLLIKIAQKDTWSEEEDKVLIEAHKEMGNKWAEIARRLPGRSENTIKNHWNATKRRQISKKKNNNKDSNNNTNKSNQASSLLQNYIISLINSSSSTSTTSITTNPPPNHDHDDDDGDDNNIADQYLNIITYTGVHSSDVSSGTDQWEAHQLLFNDDHNNKAAAIDVVASDCDRSRMFSESNNYLLDGLQPSGSGINYNDSSSMDLDLDFDFDLDLEKKDLDLLEMIIFQGNSDQF